MRNLTNRSVLTRWVAVVSSVPRFSLSCLVAITIFCGWYGASHFKINSDLNKLVDQTSDWRVDFDRFESQFPDLVHTAVVVVSSSSLKDLEDVTKDVLAHLEARNDLFTAVAAPGSEAFFRDRALLYMDVDQLDDAADRLARAQPLINKVHQEPSVLGVADLVADGFDNDPPAGFSLITDQLAKSANRVLSGDLRPVKWTDELFPLSQERFQLIYLKPKSVFAKVLPDADMVAGLRAMVAQLDLPAGVRVQLTGEITLAHEEVEAAVEGISKASWLAVGLLFLVLLVGVRSGKIIVATFSMLAIGMIWTTAFAMFAVGEFNTLSLVFIVMFFGLGVDFALHFCMRFQESINRGEQDLDQALFASTQSVGRAISLCSLTTAIGFLGFWPTAYQGLADLGVISAAGMAIAWLLTFTYLPVFFKLAGAPRAHEMDLPTTEGVVRWLLRRRMKVAISVAVLGVAAMGVAVQSKFDYSVLALKDPSSPSMLALRELQREGQATDYQLVVLSPRPVDREKVLALASVSDLGGASEFIPARQDEKLAVMEDLSFMFWDVLEEPMGEGKTAADDVRRGLLQMADAATGQDQSFASILRKLAEQPDHVLVQWQHVVLENLLAELQWLRRALTVDKVSLQEMPSAIGARLRSAQGSYLNTLTPKQDITNVAALSAFITEVRQHFPQATGRPVIEWGVGRIIIEAFQQALLFALIGIVIVLIMTLRKIGPTLLVLCPLLLASACTFALGVLLGQSVNMASVLVLPLIFGLGVDNGIHVVDRFLVEGQGTGEQDVDQLMHSSTPRAVLLSTFTTIGAFAALSISPHQGTASIGLLLSVGVGFILLFTVFILPVLLSFLPRSQA